MTSLVGPVTADGKAKINKANATLMVFVLSMLAVLVIPVPPFILDLLITANITVSILILLATLSARSPLDFSAFPSVLLFSTIMRLSLNVASTRLILLHADAGSVIQAFGEFVAGGNYVVGVVIFLILIIIQFVVITKGQNRIAEVAARFTLDAMPGKQMAVDADVAAGVLSNEEAKAMRKEIAREAEFFGAMDGAGKFIRGDALAGLIITFINILGGIFIGVWQLDIPIEQAFTTYTILTIGDGLASQLPALVTAIASGILVTKAASKEDLAKEVVSQVAGNKTGVMTAGVVLTGMGLVPGLPSIPFMVIGGALLLYSRKLGESSPQSKEGEAEQATGQEENTEEHAIEDLLSVDRLGIEIGYRLISIVDPGRHGGLLEHIASLRRNFASSLGFVVPPIRVKDNIQLEPNSYRILLMGQEVAQGELRAGQFLAMDPTGSAPAIEGKEMVEPAFGLPARWITEGAKEQAEVLGYTVIDAPSVLITHMTEIIKKIANELLSREDVQALLDNVKKGTPTVVEEVVPNLLTTAQVQRVLAGLLKEQVAIRNLPIILEAIGDAAQESKDPNHLIEAARLRIARSIVEPFLANEGTLNIATIEPELERQLLAAVTGNGDQEVMAQGLLGSFVEETAKVLAGLVRNGHQPVLVTRAGLRPFLAEAVVGAIPGSATFSYQEIATVKKVNVMEQIGPGAVAG